VVENYDFEIHLTYEVEVKSAYKRKWTLACSPHTFSEILLKFITNLQVRVTVHH